MSSLEPSTAKTFIARTLEVKVPEAPVINYLRVSDWMILVTQGLRKVALPIFLQDDGRAKLQRSGTVVNKELEADINNIGQKNVSIRATVTALRAIIATEDMFWNLKEC